MINLIKKVKGETGQAMVIFAVAFVMLCGCAALAIDIGSVIVEKGALQKGIDAAAVAGSMDLPGDPTAAEATAKAYAVSNGISSSVAVTIDENSITVSTTENVPLFFAKIFGNSSKNITSSATAVSGIANSVPWIVPFVIPQPYEFNYDHKYVMRMYGSGPYPDGYTYPTDFLTDSDYSGYTTYTYTYKTNAKNVKLYSTTQELTKYLVTTISSSGSTVTYVSSTTVSGVVWYKVTYGGKTGWVKASRITKTQTGVTNDYPYQFDYMNVNIKAGATFSQYINWLEYGYHEKFTVGETMYYSDPSSGGRESVDAFARRCTRDSNTDYTKAKVGDGRVILIPVVQSMLPRNTPDNTHITVLGFAAFYIEQVHKNSYGATFWFEGRFLQNVTVDSDDVTFDPNADYGVRVTKLVN